MRKAEEKGGGGGEGKGNRRRRNRERKRRLIRERKGRWACPYLILQNG